MHGEQQHVLLPIHPQQTDPQQRTTCEVKAAPGLSTCQLADLQVACAPTPVAQINDWYLDCSLWSGASLDPTGSTGGDDLNRTSRTVLKGRPQCFVPLHYCGQTAFQRRYLQRAAETKNSWDVVPSTALIPLIQKP